MDHCCISLCGHYTGLAGKPATSWIFKTARYMAEAVAKYTNWEILQIAEAKSRCEP